MKTTTIRLAGIEAWGRHGVYAEEKAAVQRFVIDVDCVLNRRDEADDLATTLDYAALAGRVARLVADESYDLIETLASRVAQLCVEAALVTRVSVTVHKPEVRLDVADVSVTVQMTKEAE